MDFATATIKRRYDSRHKPREYEVGQKVYYENIKLHHGYHLPCKLSQAVTATRRTLQNRQARGLIGLQTGVPIEIWHPPCDLGGSAVANP